MATKKTSKTAAKKTQAVTEEMKSVVSETAAAEEKVEAAVNEAVETVKETTEAAEVKAEATVNEATEAVKETTEAAEVKAEASVNEATEAVKETAEAAEVKAEAVVTDAAEAAEEAAGAVTDTAEEVGEKVTFTFEAPETASEDESPSEEADTAEQAELATGEEIPETAQAEPAPSTKKAPDHPFWKNGIKRPPRTPDDKRRSFEIRKSGLQHTTAQMSAKLKGLISDEIEAYKKRKKRRSAEILGVFAKHNFYANGFTPIELRTTLEDLGPTYVKIGQIMSSRTDMLPESYCKELEKLRSNVKPLDAEIARAVIEQETGKSIDEIYSEFRDKPLGSASIGQAHYGVLKDGTRVVTKVQRPLIAEMMCEDFVMLKTLAGALDAAGNDKEDDSGNLISLVSVIEELEKVTEEELDFRIEAANTRFFKENCIEDPEKVNCPDVFPELTTERIFTMTFVDGCSVAKKQRLIDEGCDLDKIGTALIENYVHQILDIGTFHADPHQGNIMVSHGVPYWIDFGMIGRITDADINVIQNLVVSLLQMDMEGLVNAIMSMGAASPKTDRQSLMEDAQMMIDKYMNIQSAEELDMAVLLGEITDLAAKNHITIPGRYTMLVRSIATIEGVIAELCPTVDLFKILSDKMLARVKKSIDITKSLITAGQEILDIGKKTSRIPVLAYDALNGMVRGRTKLNLELTGYEELVDKAGVTVRNIVLSLFSCVLFFGSCILATTDIQPQMRGTPLIAVVGLTFSIALGVYTVKKLSKKKK